MACQLACLALAFHFCLCIAALPVAAATDAYKLAIYEIILGRSPSEVSLFWHVPGAYGSATQSLQPAQSSIPSSTVQCALLQKSKADSRTNRFALGHIGAC